MSLAPSRRIVKIAPIMRLTVAYSPCPNDTFMFHGLDSDRTRAAGYELDVHLHDIETLNRLAMEGCFDVTKISFHAYLLARDHYELLASGSAVGRGCGPVCVSRERIDVDDLPRCVVAVPGELTTAHLLLRLLAPRVRHTVFVRYDAVMPMVARGEADCGVVIHEGRFVYERAGLHCVVDLGQWWENRTGMPMPLGGIVARRSLGPVRIAQIDDLIRASIGRAISDPESAMPYVRRHAREMDEQVLVRHIETFVTEQSLVLGPEARLAVERLEALARQAGVVA